MNNNQFLKELNTNLKYLNKKNKQEELSKYNNIDVSNLDPIEEANKIYQRYNSKVIIYPKITLYNALKTYINSFKSKKHLKEIILFILYLFLLLIIIKIPFIFIRDITLSYFSLSMNNNFQVIWNLTFELLYAITTIIIFTKLIKNKAQQLNNIK